MTQQHLNLYHAGLEPARRRFTATQGLVALGVVALGLSLTIWGLHYAARQNLIESAALMAAAQQPRDALTASTAAGLLEPAQMQELMRLRKIDAGERRLRSVVDSGEAGASGGFAEELQALGRQAHGSVWLTGVTLTRQDNGLELRGRTTDIAVLPDYLQTLQAEPSFRGRQFAQLQVRSDAVDASGAALPFADFTLRNSPATATIKEAVK